MAVLPEFSLKSQHPIRPLAREWVVSSSLVPPYVGFVAARAGRVSVKRSAVKAEMEHVLKCLEIIFMIAFPKMALTPKYQRVRIMLKFNAQSRLYALFIGVFQFFHLRN